ncbi:MAG: hypothetical protein IPI57_07265 [Candidatus Competibacteraceae bacterium]|nr:hypothetical protein [Candidatus Competibacteraceae bacterium]
MPLEEALDSLGSLVEPRLLAPPTPGTLEKQLNDLGGPDARSPPSTWTAISATVSTTRS